MLQLFVQRRFAAKPPYNRNQWFYRKVFPLVHCCCRMFLKHVHNLFTPICGRLASGLEIRNQLRKRQEKNEFYFQLRQKNFLDGKNEARVSSPKREIVCLKDFVSQSRRIRNRGDEQNSILVCCASRVDRIRQCGQFLASAGAA